MAKRARVDEAKQDENKQSSKPANALTKYQKEMEVFIRTKLGQNVVFGMKNCDKHLRVSYHSEDVNQKENRKTKKSKWIGSKVWTKILDR